MHRSPPIHVPAIIGALLLLAACGGDQTASSEAPASAASQPSTAASEAALAPASEAALDEPAEMVEVRIVGSAFEPAELTIAAGTEVVWVNDDSYAHTVTHGTDGDAVDDPIVDEHIDGGGDEVRVVFDEAGSFPITCEIHPSMQMEITVEG